VRVVAKTIADEESAAESERRGDIRRIEGDESTAQESTREAWSSENRSQ
jgi:hypothetical protein